MDDILYPELRKAMIDANITWKDMAEEICMKEKTLAQRLYGHAQFKLNEMYDIMEVLEIDPKNMAYYFPRDGKKA